ncbi:hypothetical protein LT875_002471 [Salmonella enterica]|nr:hypothetical protein [Salmonella enterica]
MKKLISALVLAATMAISAQASAAYSFNAGSEGRMVITDDINIMMMIDHQGNKTRYHGIKTYNDIDDNGDAYIGTIYIANNNPHYAIIVKSYDTVTMMMGIINEKVVINQPITAY